MTAPHGCRTGLPGCNCNWREVRYTLDNLLGRARSRVDANIPVAASWSGASWFTGSIAASDHTVAYTEQFNRLTSAGRAGADIDWSPDNLNDLQRRLTGDNDLRRTVSLRKNGHVFPNAGNVLTLLADACEEHRYKSVRSHSAALSFHLDILTIHPFEHANGPIARLVAASQLVKQGMKSTLLTIIDQQYMTSRDVYERLLHAYWSGVLCRDSCLNGMLLAAVARTRFVMPQPDLGRLSGSVFCNNVELAEIVEPLLELLVSTDQQVQRKPPWSVEKADQVSRWETETTSHRYFGEPFLATTREERDPLRSMASAPPSDIDGFENRDVLPVR